MISSCEFIRGGSPRLDGSGDGGFPMSPLAGGVSFSRVMKFAPRGILLRQGDPKSVKRVPLRQVISKSVGGRYVIWGQVFWGMGSGVLVRYSFLTFSDLPYFLVWAVFRSGRFLGVSSSGFSVMMEESQFPMGINGPG